MNSIDVQSWKWQLQNQIRTLKQLEQVFPLTKEEIEAIQALDDTFRLGITPYYLSLMDSTDLNCPIRRQAIPLLAEQQWSEQEVPDPLAEERDMPVVGVTNRYPNRALLYVTHTCAVYCRHCTRRRKVGDASSHQSKSLLKRAIEWINDNPQIDDVVLSGGDPLSLSNSRLNELLTALKSPDRIVRIGTRHPTTLPQRITPDLCSILKEHAPVYIMTHFNHPKECTVEASRSLSLLADAGCVLSNQTVLLKGINDNAQTLQTLNKWLLYNRCRPYRLFHCDYTQGVGHFRVPMSQGLDIIQEMRGYSSGLEIPEYVIDLPNGLGKAPVSQGKPNQDGTWTFTTWAGDQITIQE